MAHVQQGNSQQALRHSASSLLSSCGLASKDFQIVPLPGGRNNRVHRLDVDGASYLLKEYHCDPRDSRDRLASEFAFMEYAVKCAPKAVPQPLACDAHAGLGLYTFVEGRPLSPQVIDSAIIRQAAIFFRRLNDPANISGAYSMPLASEACFSIKDHLQCVQHRLERLDKVVDPQARAFIKGPLAAAWERVAGEVQLVSIDKETPLPRNERCVSPSDFGFHNALIQDDGQIRFLDFEYGGWDDPAKMLCDFFCQPEVPVDEEFFSIMWEATAANVLEHDSLWIRVQALRPLYVLKWCCIMLNDFLPIGGARRHFSSPKDPVGRQSLQLEKAQDFLVRKKPY